MTATDLSPAFIREHDIDVAHLAYIDDTCAHCGAEPHPEVSAYLYEANCGACAVGNISHMLAHGDDDAETTAGVILRIVAKNAPGY